MLTLCVNVGIIFLMNKRSNLTLKGKCGKLIVNDNVESFFVSNLYFYNMEIDSIILSIYFF